MREDLRAIHAQSRRTYGRPRLVQALRARNHAVGHKRVARLMAEEGLCGRVKGSAPAARRPAQGCSSAGRESA
ncbi:IS3 family transposase [Stenotrophomonas sp. NPDC077464]|uniref:IS3 family transposase n=1 Tax=Stenotrophomonas sp. NPDC077464 TaxID=3364533 RepID=UPI0037D19318